MNTLKVKKGDSVKVIAGAHKGKTATVVAAYPAQNAVTLAGIGLVKRKVKPSQANPKGGTKEVHVPIDASKVTLVETAKTTKTSTTSKPAKKPAAKKGSKK